MHSEAPHIPVMLDEVLTALAPRDGGVYVDGTFGAGGYTSAILDAADCTVVAIDRDMTAIDNGAALKGKYGDRLVLLHGCFGDVARLLADNGFGKVDGFVLDIGVSSMQIDQRERGFSFRFDGPLDMRMDVSSGRTAADVVNETPESDLADILYQYGEERQSRRIARKICEVRAEAPFETTGQLANAIRSVLRVSPKDKIDPATRSFQALRIYVNDELGELDRALDGALEILDEEGRLVVVSFHSLEDRIVKKFMREHAGLAESVSRHAPMAGSVQRDFPLELPSKKAVFPSAEEEQSNPRARSARLRCAIRTNSPLLNKTTQSDHKKAEGRG